MTQQFPLGSLASSNPHPSSGYVCGSHPRVSPTMTSPRGWRSPVADIPAALFTAGGPIPPPAARSDVPVAVRNRHPPGASNGFVCGGRLRGLVRNGRRPRPRSRWAATSSPTLSPRDPERRPRGRHPGPSSGLVRGGRPRGLVRDGFPSRKAFPRPRLRRAAQSPPLPIPLLQGTASPRGTSAAGVPGAVQRPCSRRSSACLVRDGFLPRMAFPRGGRPSRPRLRRQCNISEQGLKQTQKYTTEEGARALTESSGASADTHHSHRLASSVPH